jgi:heat shock protein HtpX
MVLRSFGGSGDPFLSDRRRRSSSDSDGSPAAAILAIVILAVSVGVTVAIQAALTRQREFLADSGAVELTKDPDSLISALTKIGENPTVPHAPTSLTAFFIATPHKTSSRRADILDSHPPIADRIAALVQYAGGRLPAPAAAAAAPAAQV